ncbi:hypothetical protein DAPPUDRAFT_255544 [Daphnia pulex]|uniref:Uncharacterized protein n=1 Tax=Daphnia pulex TaxID=6669 RepID=E9H9G3_DAPPU|nr:hypothetical protein DAPPUDRAFT_255544 [Daphnia pulex]|eukprot:EFX71658.1 hypothetical protein DAPPUDRAFT_255544 [Daphnia pulex]
MYTELEQFEFAGIAPRPQGFTRFHRDLLRQQENDNICENNNCIQFKPVCFSPSLPF